MQHYCRLALLSIGIVLGVAGRANADPSRSDFSPPMRAQAREAISKVRGHLDAKMLDLPSARFRDVRAVLTFKDARGPIICGYVNGKNRMGAYVGWKPFAGFGSGVFLDDDGTGVGLAEDMCRNPHAVDTFDYTPLIAQR